MSTRAKRAWSGSCTTLQMITCVASSPSCIPARSRPVALRVAFNAAPLLRPLTGIGNHIVHLGAALAATGGVDLWSFYGYRWRHEAPTPPAGGTAGDIVLSRARDLVKPSVPYRRELREAVQRVLFGRGARRHGIELHHEPNFYRAPVPRGSIGDCDPPPVDRAARNSA